MVPNRKEGLASPLPEMRQRSELPDFFCAAAAVVSRINSAVAARRNGFLISNGWFRTIEITNKAYIQQHPSSIAGNVQFCSVNKGTTKALRTQRSTKSSYRVPL